VARKSREQTQPGTAFVLLRENWRRYADGWRLREGPLRLASFDSAKQAEAERASREQNARLRLNPFRCAVDVNSLTSFPVEVLLAGVRVAGLEPPPKRKGRRDWAAWWDETVADAPADQRLELWGRLDRVRFYFVEPRPALPVGHVVLTGAWTDVGDGPRLGEEGGEVRAVYRTRRRAWQEALRMAPARGGPWLDWFPSGLDPFDPETHWTLFQYQYPSCDVVEVEVGGLDASQAGQTVHLVVRRTWERDGIVCEPERVPVRGFADGAAAEAHRQELEDDFRHRHDAWELFSERIGDAADYGAFFAAGRVGIGKKKSETDFAWWRRVGQTISVEQRLALWEAVPAESECFAFEVIESELRD
jgi:hypothetical protein